LCYGAPGVGKTLSARHYANRDAIEASTPARDASTSALTALLESHIVFYTSGVVNTPTHVAHDIGQLRSALRAIRPLSAGEVRQILQQKWLPSGVVLPEDG